MDKFYFFKVTLIYYDDVAETFFITPDQSERDEDGIPFSEQELRDTPEFKAFVKKNKADVVDVKYVEYAVEKDENKTVILGSDITAESFKTLENRELEIEIVDKNEFPVIIKQTKKAGGGSKMHYVCLAAAAVAVFAFLFANAPKMGKIPYDESSSSDYSEETGTGSETSSSEDESSSSSIDISSSSSVSSSSSSDTSSSESASSSSSFDTSSSSSVSSSSSSDTSSSSSVSSSSASE